MNVSWLIDGEMFPDYRNELIECIEHHGLKYQLVSAPSPPYRWQDVGFSYRDSFAKGNCVVAHGDIELATRIRNEGIWTPGAFCNVDEFYCSSYLCHFGKYWLNCDYAMLPFGELARQKEFLFDRFGASGEIFVRPDSPLKLFTGQTVSAARFSDDLEFMSFYEFPVNSLVVVSTPKMIDTEWRFVVANGQVISGSQYARLGKMDVAPEFPDQAKQLAQQIASQGHQPDAAWIVDICETDQGDLHMLEIGGFSFSDLYACDKMEIVAEVSRAAHNVWKPTVADDTDQVPIS